MDDDGTERWWGWATAIVVLAVALLVCGMR